MVARSSVGTTSIFGLDSMEDPITAIICSIPNISAREHIKLWISWTSSMGYFCGLGTFAMLRILHLVMSIVGYLMPDEWLWWWRWWDLNNFLLMTKNYQWLPPYFAEFWFDKTINFVLFPRVVMNIVGDASETEDRTLWVQLSWKHWTGLEDWRSAGWSWWSSRWYKHGCCFCISSSSSSLTSTGDKRR